jgi:Raf kinase inhibitor-like YbhB/YbcL family protein
MEIRMVMKISCPAFMNGAPVLSTYTCTGKNLSPEVEWSGLPEKARSLALILEDPDAPGGSFYHWIVCALNPLIGKIPAAQPKVLLPGVYGQQGINDFGQIGYDGPCPPPGKSHRYIITLFALSSTISNSGGFTGQGIKAAMHGHVIDQVETFGTFKRA